MYSHFRIVYKMIIKKQKKLIDRLFGLELSDSPIFYDNILREIKLVMKYTPLD